MMKSFVRSLVVILGLAASQARAQSPEELEAFRLYKEAKESMDSLRFQEAIEKLDKAHALYPLPQILARKAECYEKMGEMERALELYRQVKTDDPKLRGKVDKAISDIVFELNKPVELSIVTNIADVEVTVDEVEKLKAPCTIKVTRGPHTFEFRKPGFMPLKEEKNIRGAAAQIYSVKLQELLGRVILATDQDALEGLVVRLDDQEITPVGSAQAPNRTDPMNVRVGTHSLMCIKEGSAPYMTTFSVAPDTTVEVSCRFKTAAPHIIPEAVSWTMVGAGAAMIATGIGFVVSYAQDKKKYDDDQASSNPIYKPGGFSSTKHYAGGALLGVGFAVAATGSAFLIRDAMVKPKGSVVPVGMGMAPVKGGGMAAVSFAF